MPPKPAPTTSDQILEALKSDAVVEAITKSVLPAVILAVQEVVQKELASLKSAIGLLLSDNKELKVRVSKLDEENIQLKSRLLTVENKIDTMERNNRLNNVIIKGLPERSFAERGSPDEVSDQATVSANRTSVSETVCAFANAELNLKIQPSDIVYAMRLKPSPQDKIRPILIKFQSYATKCNVLAARKTLKAANKQIFLNEHLTEANSKIYGKCRFLVKQKRIYSAWTYNGQVYIRKSNDPNSRPSVVKSADDLPQ